MNTKPIPIDAFEGQWTPETGTPAYLSEHSVAAKLKANGTPMLPITDSEIKRFADAITMIQITTMVVPKPVIGRKSFELVRYALRTHWEGARRCIHKNIGHSDTHDIIIYDGPTFHSEANRRAELCCRMCLYEFNNA